jgi:NRPS condensation-like uncharacterized protein
VLRTRFLVKGDLPIQVIADEVNIEVPVEDLGVLPPSSQESEIRCMATKNALHEFHLDTGPLIYANLLRLGEREHVLLLNLHHIVFDGWSRHILLSELAALYDAYCDGRSSPAASLCSTLTMLSGSNNTCRARSPKTAVVLKQKLAGTATGPSHRPPSSRHSGFVALCSCLRSQVLSEDVARTSIS